MRLFRGMTILAVMLGFVTAAWSAEAALSVPNVIGSHMVLQRGVQVPIWGKAMPGDLITVSINNTTVSTKVGKDGRWRVNLRPMPAGGPHDMTIKSEAFIFNKRFNKSRDKTLKFEDILVGEVWVCSGQSNMQWPLKLADNPEKEIAEAKYPNMRLFVVPSVTAETPQDNCNGKWAACSPETATDFTAVGYFFGRKLHEVLGVPVGLVQTAWGGTAAEAWTSRRTLEKETTLKPILERWDKLVADYPEAKKAYDQQMEEWKKAAEQAKGAGQPEPKKPGAPAAPDNPNRPANLYNGMIAPLVPFAFRGAIWYQGESNAGRAYQYRTLFPVMIKDWRKTWGGRAFPFLFVQLANFMDRKPEPDESAWAELREAQRMTLALRNTGMAVTIDIGDAKDIHPRNKQDVGARLALNALSETYDQEIEYSGPIYRSMRVSKGKAVLGFSHANDGLAAQGGGELKGFAIAGADMKFVWAKAEIHGNTVAVWSEQVSKPAAIRYAWADNPECNLINTAGLPASPFRTDKKTGVTANNK